MMRHVRGELPRGIPCNLAPQLNTAPHSAPRWHLYPVPPVMQFPCSCDHGNCDNTDVPLRPPHRWSRCEDDTDDVEGYSCYSAFTMAAVSWFASLLLVAECLTLAALILWKEDIFVDAG